MEMTEQQIEELFDRMDAERGADRDLDARRTADALGRLLEAEDLEETASEALELAESELAEARTALQKAQHEVDEAGSEYSHARYRVRQLRHELALVRTATGYKTARQAQADAVAARVAQTLRGAMPQPAETE